VAPAYPGKIFRRLARHGRVSPAATPTITGAIAVIPSGIFNSAFHSGVLSIDIAKPMTQPPNLCAQAANINFSTASPTAD